MMPKLIAKDSFQIIGLKRTFDAQNEAHKDGIAQFWQEMKANGTTEQLAALNDGDLKALLGVCIMVKTPEGKQVLDYWIAVASTKPHERFAAMNIPAVTWAKFGVHGPMPKAMQNTWQIIYQEWFPAQSMTHAYAPDIEVYFSNDSESTAYYSEIWIPVKE